MSITSFVSGLNASRLVTMDLVDIDQVLDNLEAELKGASIRICLQLCTLFINN